jgi:hypothetical protein
MMWEMVSRKLTKLLTFCALLYAALSLREIMS